MTLAELQRAVTQALSGENTAEIINYLQGDANLSAEERLQIYANSIQATLLLSLQDRFPVCEKLLGTPFFIQIANQYIVSHPSRSNSLFEYGDHFSLMLKELKILKNYPYLSDVAAFEWAWHRACYGAPAEFISINDLASISEEAQMNLCFQLQKNGTLIISEYPLMSIIAANQEGASQEENIDLSIGGGAYFIWREALTVRAETLTKNEADLAMCMNAGIALQDYPDKVFATFQQDLLSLMQKRIILYTL